MARLTGCNGGVSLNDYGILFNTWSATISQTITDTTSFTSTFGNRAVGGPITGTFSAGGVMQGNTSSSAPMPGGGTTAADVTMTGGTITLTASPASGTTGSVSDTACAWTGTVVVGNVSPSVTQNGESICTIDGEFDGAIQMLWDES